eukprot:5086332-Amphidinium_carterae.2
MLTFPNCHLLDGIKLRSRLWQSNVHISIWFIVSEADIGRIRATSDASPARVPSTEAHTLRAKRRCLNYVLWTIWKASGIGSRFEIEDAKLLGLDGSNETIEEVVSAFPEPFKGGRDSPLDPLSFKGQPTEVTCDRKVLKQLQKVGGSLLWLVTRSGLDIAYSHSRSASLQTKDTKTSNRCLRRDISFAPGGSRSQAGIFAPSITNCFKHLDSDTSIRAHRLTEAVNQGNDSLGCVGTKDQRSHYLTKLAPKMLQASCIDALGTGWVSEWFHVAYIPLLFECA